MVAISLATRRQDNSVANYGGGITSLDLTAPTRKYKIQDTITCYKLQRHNRK